MELTIFAKRRTNIDGKIFFQYLSTLPKRDGTTETMRVCFRDVNPPKPESCPRNIITDKSHANISVRKFTDKNGELRDSKTLWISDWSEGTPYVDHSLDEYNFD